jgi:hypothetical protein
LQGDFQEQEEVVEEGHPSQAWAEVVEEGEAWLYVDSKLHREFVVIGTSQLSSVGGLLLNHGSVADESSYDV